MYWSHGPDTTGVAEVIRLVSDMFKYHFLINTADGRKCYTVLSVRRNSVSDTSLL